MILDNELYENMLDGAKSMEREIDDSDFSNEEAINLSKRLKHIILLHCEETIDPVLQAHTTQHGLELWRRLHHRFNPRSRMTSMGRLVSIMAVTFELSTLENQLVLWEQEISKYEAETNSLLPDTIKIALLIKGTSGNLQEWIQLNGSTMNVYADVRNMIVNYVRSKKTFPTTTLSPSTSPLPKSTPTPMEIDAVWKQIKGKSKGRGKSKGKAKAPEDTSTEEPSSDSKPTCDHCGGTHKSKNCWYKPQSTSSSWTEYVDEHGNKWTMSDQTSNTHWNGSKGKGKGIKSMTESTPTATTPSVSTVIQPPPGLSENKPKTQFIWGILQAEQEDLPGDDLHEPERGQDLPVPQNLPGEKSQDLFAHLSNNVENFMSKINIDINDLKCIVNDLLIKVEEIIDTNDNAYNFYHEENSKLVKKIDEVIDEHIESRDIYAAEHSKLIDLLDQKFNELQSKVKPLLREPKISDKLEIYHMETAESILHSTSSSTSSTSTTSTSSSTPSNSIPASTQTDNDEFYDWDNI